MPSATCSRLLRHRRLRQVTEWFDLGGTLRSTTRSPAAELLRAPREVQGLSELTHTPASRARRPPLQAAAVDFILEGLYAQKKITGPTTGSIRAPSRRAEPAATPRTRCLERDIPMPGNKKKYYN